MPVKVRVEIYVLRSSNLELFDIFIAAILFTQPQVLQSLIVHNRAMSCMHQRLLTTVTICTRSGRCLVLNAIVSPTGAIMCISGSHIDATTSIVKRRKQAETVEHLHELNVAVVTCKVNHVAHDFIKLLPDLGTFPQAQHGHFLYRRHYDWQCTRSTAVALLPKCRAAVLVVEYCTWTSCSKTNRLE